MPAREALDAAGRAAEHLASSPEWRAAGRVALYAALVDEMPSRPFYERALRAARVLLWPRLAEDDRLEFAPCARWEELRPGRYGVPSPAAAPVALSAGDLVLVPGLAFDGRGRRLGRGGGHYDRALAAAGEGTVTIGVGYEFQRVAEVPEELHDVALDGVVTEAGLFRSAGR